MSEFVYRAYDHKGDLLYVGVTNNFDNRMAAHAQQSGWWLFQARIEREDFATRDEALAEEKRLIQTLHPRWNRKDRLPGPVDGYERYETERHIWRKRNQLQGQRSRLRSELREVEAELEVIALAIEGLSGGVIQEEPPTVADRKRVALRALREESAS